MTSLGARAHEFVERMQESTEQESWGFEILSKRSDAQNFLGLLREKGFFNPERNPASISVDGGRYIRVPYWPALDYLEACARHSVAESRVDVQSEILDIVKEVTEAAAKGISPANYHTFSKFAEIVGLMRSELISDDVIGLIPTWLSSEFDTGLVASEIDQGILVRLVGSEEPAAWRRAVRVIGFCTGIRLVSKSRPSQSEGRVESIVDDFWVKSILDHHVNELARKVPEETSKTLTERLKDVYTGDRASWLDRPAIETHQQNHEWGKIENHLVDAARDALLIWIDRDAESARRFVGTLIADDCEVLRRLAVYSMSAHWPEMQTLVDVLLVNEPFAEGLLHETFQLLNARFSSFELQTQNRFLDELKSHTESLKSDVIGEMAVRYVQRQWLMAMEGKGNARADSWFQELMRDPALGPLPEHPDFHVYSESLVGSGPSPYSSEELVELSRRRLIVATLNAFVEEGSWRGPSVRSLVHSLEEAVLVAPNLFLGLLDDFKHAQPSYQYGVLNGLRRLWESDKTSVSTNWDSAWPSIFKFFAFLLDERDCFGAVVVNDEQLLSPTHRWLPSLISDFIRAGSKNDEKAFEPAHFEEALAILCKVLDRAEAATEAREDAMTQAINSERGKALDALFTLGLRMCRVADRGPTGSHTDVAGTLTSLFDRELELCRDANFEFSALAGAYLPNLEYVDFDWTVSRIAKIFPAEYPKSLQCAVSGLSYAPARKSTYLLLRDNGIVETIFRAHTGDGSGRRRVLERVALAYLWGVEPLEGEIFNEILPNSDDLKTVAGFFARVRREELNEVQIGLVLRFLAACLEHISESSDPMLMAALSSLVVFIPSVGEVEGRWLSLLAPFAFQDHRGYDFVRELLRLVDSNPAAVSQAFGRYVATAAPAYDYKDRMRDLVAKLAENGLRAEALAHADSLRHLQGMRELFRTLSVA